MTRPERAARRTRPDARDGAEISEFLPLRSHWLHVLLAVAGGHQHGYAIRQEVEQRTSGRVKLWPATLYGTLGALLDAGLLEETADAARAPDADARRRCYALTELGRRVLAAEIRRLEEIVAIAHDRRVAGELGAGPR